MRSERSLWREKREGEGADQGTLRRRRWFVLFSLLSLRFNARPQLMVVTTFCNVVIIQYTNITGMFGACGKTSLLIGFPFRSVRSPGGVVKSGNVRSLLPSLFPNPNPQTRSDEHL